MSQSREFFRSLLSLAVGVLAVGGVSRPCLSQVSTVRDGGEFQVNTVTTNAQSLPAIAAEPDGDFVVVWASRTSSDTDTSEFSIQGQRFASDGSTVGSQFQVNTYTTGTQEFPSVSVSPDGAFVVAWEDYLGRGDVFAQRFDSDGQPTGGEFTVNTYSTSSQSRSSLSPGSDGSFVAVWTSTGSSDTDSSSSSVQGRRYASDGSAIGSEFQVNTVTTGYQGDASVAVATDGSFIVVWESASSGESDTSSDSIQGRRYASDGSAVGNQFQVNVFTMSSQTSPSVSMDSERDFVVVWSSNGSAGTDSSSYSVQARRYTSDGMAVGGQFQVNSATTSAQFGASLSVDPEGDFVVTWESSASSEDDTSPKSVQGQRYTSDGSTVGGEFQVNTYTTSNQESPAVFTDIDGDFVVVWRSFGSSGTDTSSTSIQGQRYRVTADVGDFVWLDEDWDGLQDSEPGVEGVTVNLYDESDMQLVATTVTDADGAFLFRPKIGLGGVVDELYLKFEAPVDTVFTTADVGGDDTIDSDVDVLLGTTPSFQILSAGDAHLDVDAGLISTTQIGDRVWSDENGNGIQDGGEAGVSDVTVTLHSTAAPPRGTDPTTTTNADGYYTFVVDPGFYYLEFTLPPDYTFVARDQGADDGVDSDADPGLGTTIAFEATVGSVTGAWDAGLELSTIGDRVWYDTSGDGRQQPNEDGLSDITVRLLDDADGEVASTTTDADGTYGFLGVETGDYRIEVEIPSGAEFSPQDTGTDDLLDSDVDPVDGRTALFSYTAGTGSRTYDAGVRFPSFFEDGFESGDTTAWSG